MQRGPLFLLVCLMLGLISGCKKEETDPKAALLLDKNWQVTAISVTSTGAQTGTVDAYALLQPCQKDNYVRFSADKTLEQNEGADRCPDNPQQSKGRWDVNPDYTTINLQLPELSQVAAVQMDIVALEETRLVLRSTVVQPELTLVTVTTFGRQ